MDKWLTKLLLCEDQHFVGWRRFVKPRYENCGILSRNIDEAKH